MWNRGQVISADFALAILVLLMVVGFVFTRWVRIMAETQEVRERSELIDKAFDATNALLTEGVPTRWHVQDVISLGLVNDRKLNETKIRTLWNLGYERVRTLLGLLGYELELEVSDALGNPIRIGGVVREPVAYFAKDPDDIEIRDMLNGSGLVWDFYWAGPGDPPPVDARYVYVDDITTLFKQMVANLTSYRTLITEDPHVNVNDLTQAERDALTNFVAGGNSLLHVQHPEDLIEIFGPSPGHPISDRGTVVSLNEILPDATIGDGYVFEQSTKSFDAIASPIPLKVIMEVAGDANRCILCKWSYGEGVIYYMPDASDEKGEALRGMDVVGRLAEFGREPTDALDVVKSERISTLEGEIAFLTILVWR
jgi:hypothetical protein